MSSKYVVTFDDHSDGVYYSGEKVSGEIKLTTTKAKNIRAIHVTVIGFTEVRFTDDKDSDRHEATDKHEDILGSDEQHLFVRNYAQGEKNGPPFSLPPGKYSYRFEAQLPTDCPTSFDGEFGQIRYEVILTIDRSWRYNNILKEPFTVIHNVDLNKFGCFKAPVTKIDFKRIMGLLCLRTPLLLTVNCPQTGYVSGQFLTVHIFMQNFSFSHCTAVKVKLQRIVTYRSTYPKAEYREMKALVREGIFGSVPKFRRKHILATIPILSVPPSTLQTGGLISVSYRLTVKAVIAGWHKNLKVRIPITVGTVPLRSDVTEETSINTSSPSDSLKTYKTMELLLPHFDNAYDESSCIKNASYLPKYPCYEEKQITLPLANRGRRR